MSSQEMPSIPVPRVWMASDSVNDPWPAPSDMDQFRCCDACKTGSITAGREYNEAPIISVATRENLSSDRNSSQSAIGCQQLDSMSKHRKRSNLPKAYNSIRCGIVSAVMFGFAELPDAHRGETDVATACKAEDGTVYNNQWKDVTSRKPQTCIAN